MWQLPALADFDQTIGHKHKSTVEENYKMLYDRGLWGQYVSRWFLGLTHYEDHERFWSEDEEKINDAGEKKTPLEENSYLPPLLKRKRVDWKYLIVRDWEAEQAASGQKAE